MSKLNGAGGKALLRISLSSMPSVRVLKTGNSLYNWLLINTWEGY